MSDEAGGVLGNYQLGLTCQFINSNPTQTITPTLYVVIVYEGTFNIQDGNCSHMIGVLSRQDVLESQKSANVTYKLSQSVYGGDFFKSLKNAFGKVHDFVKGNKIISKVAKAIPHPYSQAAGHAADQLGYGASGGNKMSKAELKRRLRGAGLAQENTYDELDISQSDSE